MLRLGQSSDDEVDVFGDVCEAVGGRDTLEIVMPWLKLTWFFEDSRTLSLRSKPFTLNPALTRFPAMDIPMFPRPIKPTFYIGSVSAYQLTLGAAVANLLVKFLSIY